MGISATVNVDFYVEMINHPSVAAFHKFSGNNVGEWCDLSKLEQDTLIDAEVDRQTAQGGPDWVIINGEAVRNPDLLPMTDFPQRRNY